MVKWFGKYIHLIIKNMTYKKIVVGEVVTYKDAFTQTTPMDEKTVSNEQPKNIDLKKKDSTKQRSNSFGKKIDFNKFTNSTIEHCNVVNSHGKFISNKTNYNSLYRDLRNELSLEEQRKAKYPDYGLSAKVTFKKIINIIKELDMTIYIDIKLDTEELFHYSNSSPQDLSIVTECDRFLRDNEKINLETSSKRNRCWAYVVKAASSKSLNDRNWKDHLQRDIADETILEFLESAERGMKQDGFRKYCGNDCIEYINKELTYNIRDIRKSLKNVYNEFASHHIFVAMICDNDDNAPLKRYGKLKMYKSGDPDYLNIQDNNLDTLEVAHTDGNHFSFVL